MDKVIPLSDHGRSSDPGLCCPATTCSSVFGVARAKAHIFRVGAAGQLHTMYHQCTLARFARKLPDLLQLLDLLAREFDQSDDYFFHIVISWNL